MKQINLNSTIRTQIGGNSAKRYRKSGQIPAVIYGESGEKNLLIDEKSLVAALKQVAGKAVLIELAFSDGTESRYAMLKDAEEGECFSYTVSTDEMRNIGIMPGDECIFLSCTSAKSGDIVLCSIEDSDSLMLRRLFMRTDGLFVLIPENDTMGKTTANKVIIHGRLILSVRRYLG